ncbi:uncharacterized protein [Venturia canescens]|uniref:uncharacterized protein n=1 Tax=Venturia canescens TaxID=32260 RepID=UPI001C9D5104|nr:uncharacterized protein LOC122414361 [Venturia canescens]
MLKRLAVVSVLFVAVTMAQRSPYAGNPNRPYPEVLPQYLTPDSNNIESSPGVAQRFGETGASSTGGAQSQNYQPYDPYTDQELIDRIKTWPKEKQPFWYVNREAIKAAQRGSGSTNNSPLSTTTVQQRGSFAGRA